MDLENEPPSITLHHYGLALTGRLTAEKRFCYASPKLHTAISIIHKMFGSIAGEVVNWIFYLASTFLFIDSCVLHYPPLLIHLPLQSIFRRHRNEKTLGQYYSR